MSDIQDVVDDGEIPEYRPDSKVVDPAPPGGDDVEEQARALGWKPEEEFEGNPGKWTDAEAFLELHSKNNGALRKAVAAQQKELENLKKQMSGMDAAHKKIFDMQIKKQKEEFDQQVAFLKAQKREALRSGEHETAADIDEQLDVLRERGPELPEAPENPQSTAPDPNDWKKNPVMVEWASRNPWFTTDDEMTATAGGIGTALRAKNPTMDFAKLLEETTRLVRKAFPEKFETRRAAGVEEATPGATRAATGAKTYASLPKDARAACDEAVAEGGLTQKQWVELYYGYDDRRKR
jgi:hypothetical protein